MLRESEAVRVGYARHPDAAVVVAQCAAILGCGLPRMLLVFVGGKLDPVAVLAGLRLAFGPEVPIAGGSAAGVISRNGFGYSGFELGLIGFYDPASTPQLVVSRALSKGEHAAGMALGTATRAVATQDALVLLLFDSVANAAPGLRLHPASALVEGFTAGLDGLRVHLLGGGLLTDINMTDGWVYDGEAVVDGAAVALIFPRGVAARTVILHGCRPVSSFMEITRIEGAELMELDGAPALATIQALLDTPARRMGGDALDLSLSATLGQKHGDPFAPYDENAYVNRLILRVDAVRGSVTLFEPDFHVGARVQIMSRDNDLMLDSARRGVAAISAMAGREGDLLCLYVDCAGRASARTGAAVEEAELVARGLGLSAPFLGFYSGVEVAPFADGVSRPLDWTGVLTLIRAAGAAP
jgi:hypothetical protein